MFGVILISLKHYFLLFRNLPPRISVSRKVSKWKRFRVNAFCKTKIAVLGIVANAKIFVVMILRVFLLDRYTEVFCIALRKSALNTNHKNFMTA